MLFSFSVVQTYIPSLLAFCSYYFHLNLISFDRFAFVATVDPNGRGSVFRDQEVIHSHVQFPMQFVSRNAAASACVDGEPCIAIAGWGKGAGVYIRHAVNLDEVRSLPYREHVYCVCINATGTKLFFGTRSGWIC